MKRIAVVGTGEVGSRHLQGLSTLPSAAHIYGVDPDPDSRKLARERWKEVRTNRHEVAFCESIEDLPVADLDLGIVATTSAHRRAAVESLLGAVAVDNLVLEKVLFQRLADYEAVESLLNREGVRAWVNCTRRTQSSYQNLRTTISEGPIDIYVTGTDWALASNGIHFVDLFGWITGLREFTWNRSGLDEEILENRREGFKEVVGKLSLSADDGSSLTLRSFRGPPTNPVVHVSTPRQRWTLLESENRLLRRSWTKDGDWELESTTARLEYQSELTGDVATDIFDSDQCELTAYGESATYHRPYVRTLLEHFDAVLGTSLDRCPIT